jgi:hypothetical protein
MTPPVASAITASRCSEFERDGNSDLIDVRFCPLCGLKSDISRGPRSAISGCEQMQQVAPLLDDLVGESKECLSVAPLSQDLSPPAS